MTVNKMITDDSHSNTPRLSEKGRHAGECVVIDLAIIPDDALNCPICEHALKRTVALYRYKFNAVARTSYAGVLFCENCNEYFGNNSCLERIRSSILSGKRKNAPTIELPSHMFMDSGLEKSTGVSLSKYAVKEETTASQSVERNKSGKTSSWNNDRKNIIEVSNAEVMNTEKKDNTTAVQHSVGGREGSCSLEDQLRVALKNSNWTEGIPLNNLLREAGAANNTKAISILRAAEWAKYEFKRCWYLPTQDEISERSRIQASSQSLAGTESLEAHEAEPTEKSSVREENITELSSFSSALERQIYEVLCKQKVGISLGYLQSQLKATTSWDAKQILRILQGSSWAVIRGGKIYRANLTAERMTERSGNRPINESHDDREPVGELLQPVNVKEMEYYSHSREAKTEKAPIAERSRASQESKVHTNKLPKDNPYSTLEEELFSQLDNRKLKFLGQAEVSSENYRALINYLREFFQNARIQSVVPCDLLIAVALVQIAIRNYGENEKFWDSVTQATSVFFSTQKANYAGRIFLKTAQKLGLFILPKEDGSNWQYVENIKAHAFVTDAYMQRFFEFASAFYEKNLLRELSPDIQDDFGELSDFMQTTLRNSGDAIVERNEITKTSKFYRLLKSTRAVFAYADKQTIYDLFFPSLQLIDRYFYDDIRPQNPTNRFEKGFLRWCDEAEQKASEVSGRATGKRSILSRRPYLRVSACRELASVVIPPQKFRHEACDGNASAIVTVNGRTITYPLELYRSFGMYISEELSIPVSGVFDEIGVRIVSLKEKSFTIPAQDYRIFSPSWSSIPRLRLGQNYLLAKKNLPIECQREQDLIESSFSYQNWQYHSFTITAESVVFIDNRPLSVVGEYSPEPIFENQIQDYLVTDEAGKKLLVSGDHPRVSFLAESRKLRGSALLVNGKRYPLESITEKSSFVWPKDKTLSAVSVDLASALPQEDGRYQIVLDIPAEPNRAICDYLILADFRCVLDKPAYFYENEALLFIREGAHHVTEINENWAVEEKETEKQVCVPLDVHNEQISFQIDGKYRVSMPVPMFQYGFSQESMRIDWPEYLWYADLEETLYLKVPGAEKLHVSYAGAEWPIRASGVKISAGFFRIDVSSIKQAIRADTEKRRHDILILYTDEKEKELLLPPFLRKIEITPYFKLRWQDGMAFCDVKKIVGKANAFLTVVQTDTQQPALEDFPITVGRNILPGVGKSVLYDFHPYMEESDDFGFSSEKTELKSIIGVSCEDWNDLEGCMLSVESVLYKGKNLNCDYDYYLVLEEKIGQNRYLGSMFGRCASDNRSTGQYAQDSGGKTITSKLGKALIDLSVGENEIKAFPKLYSYVDEEWSGLFFDSQKRMLLHADDWLLTQQRQETRFIKLTPAILMINTDKIRRIQYAVQTV